MGKLFDLQLGILRAESCLRGLLTIAEYKSERLAEHCGNICELVVKELGEIRDDLERMEREGAR